MTVTLDLSLTDRAPATAGRMASAALDFLASLNPAQRQAATLPFGDDRRYVWDYRPPENTPRNGLRLINMNAEQQRQALALLDIGLSTSGASTVRQIIDLELPLLEQEQREGRVTPFVRHPEHYSVCVFGDPQGRLPWAWHVGGHHVGVHFTIVDGDRIASVPLFFGANPAEVRHGALAGHRTLPVEEDLARAIIRGLPAEQQHVALVSETAFPDILTDRYRVVNAFAPPTGLAFGRMAGEQRDLLVRLLRHYVERTNNELSGQYWRRMEAQGFDAVTFAWAGGLEPGQGHYYTIKAPTWLIEYDNTQNGANHIHSVLRDIHDDWGADLIAAHYAASHLAAVR
ncbi:MAG TPA: DUF3500 domain-containing protein [Chloroflexota bacterium]|nr:DUF3500 domain-containing protein [Chloroflexota bacterium]